MTQIYARKIFEYVLRTEQRASRDALLFVADHLGLITSNADRWQDKRTEWREKYPTKREVIEAARTSEGEALTLELAQQKLGQKYESRLPHLYAHPDSLDDAITENYKAWCGRKETERPKIIFNKPLKNRTNKKATYDAEARKHQDDITKRLK